MQLFDTRAALSFIQFITPFEIAIHFEANGVRSVQLKQQANSTITTIAAQRQLQQLFINKKHIFHFAIPFDFSMSIKKNQYNCSAMQNVTQINVGASKKNATTIAKSARVSIDETYYKIYSLQSSVRFVLWWLLWRSLFIPWELEINNNSTEWYTIENLVINWWIESKLRNQDKYYSEERKKIIFYFRYLLPYEFGQILWSHCVCFLLYWKHRITISFFLAFIITTNKDCDEK